MASAADVDRIRSLLRELQQEVDAIQPKAPQSAPKPRGSGDDPHRPPRLRTPPLQAADDDVPVSPSTPGLRPSLYVHKPAPRGDMLEKALRDAPHVLDALRLKSFEGMYNLSFILLCFALTYITIRNFREKGNFITMHSFTCAPVARDWGVMLTVQPLAAAWTFVVHAVISQFVAGRLAARTMFVLYTVAQAALLSVPVWYLFNVTIGPMSSAATMMVVTVLALKTHSYVMTTFLLVTEAKKPAGGGNKPASGAGGGCGGARTASLRRRKGKGEGQGGGDGTAGDSDGDSSGKPVTYGSLSTVRKETCIGHFAYFLCAPTLVYELRYPRVKGPIRWAYVWHKTLELAVCSMLMFCITSQFMLPVLRAGNSLSFWYGVLKVALPSLLTWLLGFYALFNCALNVAAELTGFADRRFYHDWWNSTTLGVFWRTWNIPVHEWCHRHVYTELLHFTKTNKTNAMLCVFLLSAVLHELLFSVAFQAFPGPPYFFGGMIMQIPAVYISKNLRGSRRGNLVMWISLFAGQPLLECLYFRDWFETHDAFYCVEA